ncbi:MAG: DUF4097 family beta strand repeat-containing protein [Nannocystaceae bacterium]
MRALIPSLLAASLGLACALGFRGATAVEADYSLAEIDGVRINLPDTPVTVLGAPLSSSLAIEGVWYSVGGSRAVAAENSTTPLLNFAREGRFGELTAIIPTEVRDVVDLELSEVRLPPDRDLEIWTGLGDVEVAQVEGNISIDVDAGHVTVFGGAEGVAIRTGAGDIEIETTGNTTATTDRGGVVVTQLGAGGNDLVITAAYGDIEATLRSDANLDLDLVGGDIRVQTRTVSTVTSGSFKREIGNGSVKVWLSARGGNVTVRLDESL